MYNFFELSQLLSIRAVKQRDLKKQNVINTESVYLRQPSSANSSIYRYALWSNAKRSTTERVLHSYIVLCITNGMLLFYRLGKWKNDRPVLRQLPWYSHPSKQIAALCFDPSGSWLLIATKDASLYILPARKFVDPLAELGPSWSADDVTEVKLPGRRARPTQICWWQTQDGQEIAIVGNELGEISFVNLVLRKEVGGTYINVGISQLELVIDEVNFFTYVLLTGTNDVQWQLILDQKQANYHWPLEKQDASASPETNINKAGSSSSLSILSCLSIAEDRINPIASSKDTRPKRLIQYAGHTLLQCQCWQNRTLVSGKYSPTAVLTVHSPDLNIVPKFIYKLPADSCHIYLADRLLFVITTDSLGSCVHLVCTELAATSIDGSKAYNPNSELQSFSLDVNENVLGLVGHSEADGCIIVTDQAVYALRSRMLPEDFFLELVLKEGDFSKADQFGKIFGLNVTALYEKAADRKLADGQVANAVRLYQLAKCSHIRTIANFATFGYVSELLSYVNVLLATRSPDFSTRDLKHFSNIALYCFIQQCLELHLSNSSLKPHFRDFLRANQHYDEQLAVRLLTAYGMYDLLLDLGDWRGLMPSVLTELLPREEDTALKSYLKPRWADKKLATALTENGFEDLLTLSCNDYFLSCLLSNSLPFYLGMHPDLLQCHISLMKKLVPLLDQRSDLRIILLMVYDPTHPAYIPILNNFQCSRQANEFNDTSCEFDFATDKPTMNAGEVLQSLVEMFLSLLVFLNKYHYSERGYDQLLVEVESRNETKENSATTQDFRLSRHHTSISCGFSHAAAVIDGTLYTWGRGASGCLGHGPVRREWLPPEPVLRPPLVRVSSVACGAAHTLAVTDAGIFSWGLNSHGQLGFGNEGGTTKRGCYPTCVAALAELDIVSVACGQYHSIVLRADGTPLSFGWGVHGQLGHGNAQNVFLPMPIEAMWGKPVSKISAGYGHSLLLTATGDVYVFGCGTFGQMATGRSAKENKPVKVELDEVIIFMAAGYFHNVVVSTSGKVFTWGCNPQTLRMRAQATRRERALRVASSSSHEEKAPDKNPENSTTVSRDPLNAAGIFLPREVNTEGVMGQVVNVACGANHSVLLTAEGICYSWGRNYGGQLGLDTRKEQLVPTPIVALNDNKIVEVKCGVDFTLVVDDDGKLYGFGMDDFGQVCGASESCHSADSNTLSSPGKIFKVRTNKRIVQIKSVSRNSVFKPVALNALPQITNRKSIEVNDSEFFTKFIAFQRLFQNDPRYSDAVVHAALEIFKGLYDGAAFEREFLDANNWQAAAKVAMMYDQYESSLSLNLKSLAEDKSLAQENKVKMALKLLKYYIRFVLEDNERLKSLLELVALFWTNCCLPTEDLEEFFVIHLHKFLGPLSMLMFSNPIMEKDDDGRLSHFMSHMSNRFCMMLVKQVIEKVKSGCPRLEFLDVLSGMMRVDASGNSQLKRCIPDGFSGLHSAPSTSEINALSELSSNSTGVKRAIDLPTTEVQELLRASKGMDKTRVLVFTCGHHYPLSTVQESVLPRFQELLSAVAPQLSTTLVNTYETQGFQPMACPKCFIEGVQQEEIVASPMVTTSAPDCFA